MFYRETFYEDHDEDSNTTTYGNRIWNDDGRVETRYDQYSNFNEYDNYKDNHSHEWNKATDDRSNDGSYGGHGENYKKIK